MPMPVRYDSKSSGNTFERKPLGMRFDLLPPVALREVAKTLAHGYSRYPNNTWRQVSLIGDDSNLNHGIGHIMQALAMPLGPERIRLLAKATTNLLFQLEREVIHDGNEVEELNFNG